MERRLTVPVLSPQHGSRVFTARKSHTGLPSNSRSIDDKKHDLRGLPNLPTQEAKPHPNHNYLKQHVRDAPRSPYSREYPPEGLPNNIPFPDEGTNWEQDPERIDDTSGNPSDTNTDSSSGLPTLSAYNLVQQSQQNRNLSNTLFHPAHHGQFFKPSCTSIASVAATVDEMEFLEDVCTFHLYSNDTKPKDHHVLLKQICFMLNMFIFGNKFRSRKIILWF